MELGPEWQSKALEINQENIDRIENRLEEDILAEKNIPELGVSANVTLDKSRSRYVFIKSN